MTDLYRLMVTVEGHDGITVFPAETHEQAERRIQRERKNGVVMMTTIVPEEDLAYALHQAHTAKGYDLKRIK